MVKRKYNIMTREGYKEYKKNYYKTVLENQLKKKAKEEIDKEYNEDYKKKELEKQKKQLAKEEYKKPENKFLRKFEEKNYAVKASSQREYEKQLQTAKEQEAFKQKMKLLEARKKVFKQKVERVERVFRPVSDVSQKVVTGIKESYSYSPKLSKSLLSIGGFSNQQQGGAVRPVGRPRGVMKWRSPFNGQPIPATEYYKQVRAFENMQEQKAEQAQRQAMQQYSQKGVAPNQIQDEVKRRMMQQMIQQQNQRNPYNPQVNIRQGQPVPPRNPTIWRGRRGVVGKDAGLFGPREVVYGLPESFFN